MTLYQKALEHLTNHDVNSPENREILNTAIQYANDPRIPSKQTLQYNQRSVITALENLATYPGQMCIQPTFDSLNKLNHEYIRTVDLNKRFEELDGLEERISNLVQNAYNFLEENKAIKETFGSSLKGKKNDIDNYKYITVSWLTHLVLETERLYAVDENAQDLYDEGVAILSIIYHNCSNIFFDNEKKIIEECMQTTPERLDQLRK